MGRTIKDDLCSSCLNVTCHPYVIEETVVSRGGEPVEEALTRIYGNPREWVEVCGDQGVWLLLYKTIIERDGCARCGEIILGMGKRLGLVS